MHIAVVGASNAISALGGVIKRHGHEHGLTVSIVLDRYYASLLSGYKVNPALANPSDSREVLAKLGNARLFSIRDMHILKSADAYLIDGTFGGTAVSRTFDPLSLEGRQLRPTMMNFMNTTVVELAGLYGKKVLVTESATLSRIRGNYLRGHYKLLVPKYYRMGLGGWVAGRASWCRPWPGEDRLGTFISDNSAYSMANIHGHRWKNAKGGFVLVVAALEHDPTHSYSSVEEHVAGAVRLIRAHTNRRIVIKPHPNSKVDFSPIAAAGKATLIAPSVHLTRAARGCYCAVMDDSTSLFQLVNLGIPCITSEMSFGARLGNTSIENLERLKYPGPEEMLEWHRDMACTEFRHEEFGDPGILKYVKELLDG